MVGVCSNKMKFVGRRRRSRKAALNEVVEDQVVEGERVVEVGGKGNGGREACLGRHGGGCAIVFHEY